MAKPTDFGFSILDFGLRHRVAGPQSEAVGQHSARAGSGAENSGAEETSHVHQAGEPIQNPKSKIQNGYVLTPRRRAAMLANPEKARVAPRDRVYRTTKRCRAANLANPQKANAVRRSTADSTEKASGSKPESSLESTDACLTPLSWIGAAHLKSAMFTIHD
jgi:hypothetical protein